MLVEMLVGSLGFDDVPVRGEPNSEVLRKVSACDDDRHFSKTLQFPHALKGHSPAIRAPQMQSAFLGLCPSQNGDFEGLSSL